VVGWGWENKFAERTPEDIWSPFKMKRERMAPRELSSGTTSSLHKKYQKVKS
jgi:hypothetical protein